MKNLFQIEEKLRTQYNSPHFGNMDDPMDELVYILLSKRTNLRCNQKTFESFKASYSEWNMVLTAQIEEIEQVISYGGLVKEKARNIKKLCIKIFHDYKTFDLRSVFTNIQMNETEIFNYLNSLPGIGPKSACCVMLYSLKLPIMPADVHVIRVFHRLGMASSEIHHHQAQKEISGLINGLPWSWIYSLHVNMKAHGERVCQKQHCMREHCVISAFCTFDLNKKTAYERGHS